MAQTRHHHCQEEIQKTFPRNSPLLESYSKGSGCKRKKGGGTDRLLQITESVPPKRLRWHLANHFGGGGSGGLAVASPSIEKGNIIPSCTRKRKSLGGDCIDREGGDHDVFKGRINFWRKTIRKQETCPGQFVSGRVDGREGKKEKGEANSRRRESVDR